MNGNSNICSELSDYEWLTGDEAGAIAREIGAANRPLHALIDNLRKRLSANRARLIVELVDLRRRGTNKFSQADQMFFTPVALAQATDEWVARYKAQRLQKLQPLGPWVDLCCGIGGDLIALAMQATATGVDLNPCIAHLAAANMHRLLPGTQGQPVDIRAVDVDDFDLAGFAAWHLDPDRRPPGINRTSSLDWSSPNLATVQRLLDQQPNAAIKLAPGADVPQRWIEYCELEWISRDRECRQLVAWHGNLAEAPGTRRATIVARQSPLGVNTGSGISSPSIRTIKGIVDQPIELTEHLEQFLFDVDPAIAAARLTGTLASEFKLRALGRGPTYLTGSRPIEDPAIGCFQVVDVLPYREKQLLRYFREHGIGRLEIKKRGDDVTASPEHLRRALKLRGDRSATLLITRVAGRLAAIVAQRVDFST